VLSFLRNILKRRRSCYKKEINYIFIQGGFNDMNYTPFIDKIYNFIVKPAVLTLLILVVIGLVEFEKCGEAISMCIYYATHYSKLL